MLEADTGSSPFLEDHWRRFPSAEPLLPLALKNLCFNPLGEVSKRRSEKGKEGQGRSTPVLVSYRGIKNHPSTQRVSQRFSIAHGFVSGLISAVEFFCVVEAIHGAVFNWGLTWGGNI